MSITIKPSKPALLRVNPSDNSGLYDVVSVWSSQTKPYVLPAPYKRCTIRTDSVIIVDRPGGPAPAIRPDSGAGVGTSLNSLQADAYDLAMNKCHEKIVAQLNSEAMFAVNYVERQSALDTIEKRFMQLYRFARKVRRFDLIGAAKELNLSGRDPRLKPLSKGRSLADTWLEFHFGIEPLYADIYAGCEVLSRPMQPKKVLVKSTVPYEDGSFTVGPLDGEYSLYKERGTVFGYAGCFMQIDDPNAYLASRLGLVNPASVAWELIPFSFVVDWVANVGQVIAQYTDFVGVKIENPYRGYVARGSYHVSYRSHWFANAGQPIFGETWTKTQTLSERILGLPAVKLKAPPLKRLSLIRAATAIALLRQFMS